MHVYTFNVAPRFTPGSPAQVDEQVARQVVVDERRGYIADLTGIHGRAEQDRALKPFALAGIVEQRLEYSDGWVIVDLLTLDVFYRFHPRDKMPTNHQRARARDRVHAQVRLVLLDQVVIARALVDRISDALVSDDLIAAIDAADELENLAKRFADRRADRQDDGSDPLEMRIFGAMAMSTLVDAMRQHGTMGGDNIRRDGSAR